MTSNITNTTLTLTYEPLRAKSSIR